MTMADMKTGEMAEITGYALGNATYRTKILPSSGRNRAVIKDILSTPLSHGFKLAVRGYHLSLRRDEAKVIKVRTLTKEEVRAAGSDAARG